MRRGAGRNAPSRFLLRRPNGEQIGEELQDDEGIVYADIDIAQCVEPKQFHDVVGYYNRYDVFDLKVRRTRQQPATFVDDAQHLREPERASSILPSDEPVRPNGRGAGRLPL
jgi:aliphatic nitrilase